MSVLGTFFDGPGRFVGVRNPSTGVKEGHDPRGLNFFVAAERSVVFFSTQMHLSPRVLVAAGVKNLRIPSIG